MSGLEKIIEKINEDSKTRCDEIIASANNQRDNIIAQAEKNGNNSADAILKDAEAEAEKMVSMAESSAKQYVKRAALAARVEVINDALSKVLDNVKNLPVDGYFNAVVKAASDNAIEGKCIAKLNKDDLARVPSGFAEKLSEELKKKGAECTLSDETVGIGSGIVLCYGDIEVNCSFEALIEAESDSYKETISKIIFQ